MGAMLPAALYGGAKDAYDMTDDEIEMVGDLMRKQRDLVKFYWKAEADASHSCCSSH